MAKFKKATGKKPAAPPASTRGLVPCAIIILVGIAIVGLLFFFSLQSSGK